MMRWSPNLLKITVEDNSKSTNLQEVSKTSVIPKFNIDADYKYVINISAWLTVNRMVTTPLLDVFTVRLDKHFTYNTNMIIIQL